MSLGSSDATITSLGGLVQLDGQEASVLRRFIYALRMPTWTQRIKAGVQSTKSQRELALKQVYCKSKLTAKYKY